MVKIFFSIFLYVNLYSYTTFYKYNNISQSSVLNSFKQVLKNMDNNFKLETYQDEINASIIDVYIDRFDIKLKKLVYNIKTIQDDDLKITKTYLTIYYKNDVLDKNFKILKDKDMHDNLWIKANYLLGLSKSYFKYEPILLNKKPDKLKDLDIKVRYITDDVILLADIDISFLDNIFIVKNIKSKIKPIKKVIKTPVIKLAYIDLNITANIEKNITKKDMDINSNIAIKDINITNIEKNITLLDTNKTIIDKNISNSVKNKKDNNITLPIPKVYKDFVKAYNILKPKKIVAKGFLKEFLEADANIYWTINMATFIKEKNAKEFIRKYKLEDKALIMLFINNNQKFVKVVYGLFKNKQEAIDFISKLPLSAKRAIPRVEGVARKQYLYVKYYRYNKK